MKAILKLIETCEKAVCLPNTEFEEITKAARAEYDNMWCEHKRAIGVYSHGRILRCDDCGAYFNPNEVGKTVLFHEPKEEA